MTDIITAKNTLSERNATFVAVKNEEIYISHKRGVTPIIEKIDEDSSFFRGAAVADKVTGKAAAMLLVKYGIKDLHTGIISRNALDFLADKNITVTYDSEVEYIINRDKTDMCPMEKSVLNTSDCDEAEMLIRATRQKLLKEK